MAVVHGKNGSAFIKTSAAAMGLVETEKVANLTAWTVNEINEVAEARVMEAAHVQRYQGMRDWNVSIEGLAEEAAGGKHFTQRIALAAGTSLTLPSATLFVVLRNSTGSAPVYAGSGVMTDFSYSSSADGVPTFSATIAGNGALRFTP